MTMLVSIVVPVYNLQDYLAETLDSILAQSYQHFEVLVVDDGSTDDTVKLVNSYQKRDSRIVLLSNQRKKGVSGARNTGIFAAKGEWIAFLDGDDLWTTDAIEVRVECINQYPDAEFITADMANFYDNTSTAESSWAVTNNDWHDCFGKYLISGKPIILDEPINKFLRSVPIWTGVAMIKTSVLHSLGGFDESLPSCEDTQLWLKVAAKTNRLVFAPKVVAYYRQREGSLVHSSKAIQHYGPDAYRKLLSTPDFKEFTKELEQNICQFNHQNCFFYRKQKNRKEAFFWSLQSLKYEPFSLVSWKNFIACCLLK